MKLKTLIIDDQPVSISMLKKMLEDRCECFVATSGLKGIKLFERALKSNEPFDIILLDIVMPGLNGIETLKKIRQVEVENRKGGSGAEHKNTRIIMQTSSEDPQDFLSSHRECDGFINKPYTKSKILEKVLDEH